MIRLVSSHVLYFSSHLFFLVSGHSFVVFGFEVVRFRGVSGCGGTSGVWMIVFCRGRGVFGGISVGLGVFGGMSVGRLGVRSNQPGGG